jgi:hypothetical protein
MNHKIGARSLAPLALAWVFASFAACNSQMTAQQIADAASQKLRAPVFLWAFNNDVCAYQQLSSLFNEYNSWNGAGERAITEKFKAYNAVVVLETRNAGPTTGELVQLQLLNNKGYVQETKTLLDSRVTPTGLVSGTVIDRGNAGAVEGKVLELQPTYSEDHSTWTVYSTYGADFFAAAKAVDAFFLDSLKDPRVVRLVIKKETKSTTCGRLARYADFF